MTRQDLIDLDLMESDAAIGIKDFMAMHDQYITSMITHKRRGLAGYLCQWYLSAGNTG